MYSLLAEMKVTYLSVGHRESLHKYHSKKLCLNGPGIEVNILDTSSFPMVPNDFSKQELKYSESWRSRGHKCI